MLDGSRPQEKKRSSGGKTPRSSANTSSTTGSSQPTTTAPTSPRHTSEEQASPPRVKKHASPTSSSKSKGRRTLLHHHEEEAATCSSSPLRAAGFKKRTDSQMHHHVNDTKETGRRSLDNQQSDLPLVAPRASNFNSYFQKLGKLRKPLPICRSRQRVEGTRGNGSIQFFIDTDTPGGHNFPSLVLVQGIEMYDDDTDDDDSDNQQEHQQHHHHRRRHITSKSPPRQKQTQQRPPTPPKPSQKRRPSRTQATLGEHYAKDFTVHDGYSSRRTLDSGANSLPPEIPKRQVSNMPASKDYHQPSKQKERYNESTSNINMNDSALLQQLRKEQDQVESNDRMTPVQRDSGTLDETLENSVGSGDWIPPRQFNDNRSLEESPTLRQQQQQLSAAQHRQRQQHLYLASNLSDEEEEEDNEEEDDDIDDGASEDEAAAVEEDEDDDDTSESDDADDHVKGYIHNYVQAQLNARLAGTPSSNSREEPVQEEELSIDPLAGFTPRYEDMSIQDSLADIEDSFAVAGMDEYSVPSVDYGYNQDVSLEQTASASSISAKELEPVKLNPVLVSPVTSASGDAKSEGLKRPTHAALPAPKSAVRKEAPAEGATLRRPTQAPLQPASTSSLRKPSHAAADLKQNASISTKQLATASDDVEPRTFRGAKKFAPRVRQPSMADAAHRLDPQPTSKSTTNVNYNSSPRGRNHGSVGSEILQHSNTSMGSSESDSSAAFQAANPYAMPESVLDQSMAFMQFDFRAEAGVTRCETNDDVQMIDSSDEDSIDEFDASMLPKNVEHTVDDSDHDVPDLDPVKQSDGSCTQRAPPRLPVRNKTNEDMPQQRGLRGLVRNFNNRDASDAPVAEAITTSVGSGRGTLVRSLSTDGNVVSPKRGLMRNFSNRAGRSASSERTDGNKRQGLFRAPKLAAEKDATKDIVKKFFNFGNASTNSLSMGNRLDGITDDWMEDEVSLLMDT